MSIALYMDVHVPWAITDALRARGVDVLTAQEDFADQFADTDLLDRALQFGRVLVTQDYDFLAIAAERQQSGVPFAGVIYSHQQGCTIGQCVSDLEVIAKVYEPQDIASHVEYLPL